jgi:sigma-B regulation protein RsbU (phosphoserine phosphatase)
MPKQPSVSGYDVAAVCVPARGVGGDYYDFIPARENRLAVAVGDVSGKGLPASLLMANVHATIRAQTQIGDAVTDRIDRANRLVCETTSFESFVTLFYGELDPERHEFTYCNAGHEHPFLLTRKGTRRLGTNGLALGVIEDFVFAEETVSVGPGDLLVVYSDGVTDTPDDAGDLFGTERLQRVIGEHRSSPADRIARAIIDEVTAHGGGKVQFDDLTVLVLRRDPEHTMV